MIKFSNPCTGFTFYFYRFSEVDPVDRFRILGNICDECGNEFDKGFLFPVLNHGMCLNCAKDFLRRNPLQFVYSSDMHFMNYYIDYFESLIKVTEEYTATDLGFVLSRYRSY